MRHTDDEIARAAQRFRQLADELDPETATTESTESHAWRLIHHMRGIKRQAWGGNRTAR